MNLKDSPKVIELKEKYRDSFQDKVTEIDSLTQQIKLANTRKEVKNAYTEYEQYIHKLAGSSGMYGYHHVSKIARELLTVLREKPELPLRELLTDQLIDELNTSTYT